MRIPKSRGRLSRRKMGVSRAESEICGKVLGAVTGPQDVGVCITGAHTMWHVEQFAGFFASGWSVARYADWFIGPHRSPG